MWLATTIPTSLKDRKEDILDRLLALSPEITEGPVDSLLIPMTRVAGYWQLHRLHFPGLHKQAQGHPFLEQLKDFHDRFALSFSLVPTAPWALWVLEQHTPKHLLETWTADLFRNLFSQQNLRHAGSLLVDKTDNSSTRADLERMLEQLEDLGFQSIADFMRIPKEHLSERFGPLSLHLKKRIQGSDDMPLKIYQPPSILERRFYPSFERSCGQDNDTGLLEQFSSTLQNWEERLRARRQNLRGLRLRVRSENQKKSGALFVTLPRATRDASTLFPVLREKWMTLTQKSQREDALEGFQDDISELVLESVGIENDADLQLDLFDPGREERQEAWNALVGQLLARSTQKSPVSIGYWKPVESYVPENAYEWAPWSLEGQPIPMIPDHPRRPHFLLKRPRLLTNPAWKSEEEFLSALEQSGQLSTLEKITEEWNPQTPLARSYARWGSYWIFWDHAQQRAFIQGRFENIGEEFLRKPT